jgi:hypothetical protein
VKERDFLQQILRVAALYGWKAWHVPAPMKWTPKGWVGAPEAAGLCDLILMHDDPPRLVFAEVKGTGGKLSGEQLSFLGLASDVSRHLADLAFDCEQPQVIGVYVLTPDHENAVEQMLRSKVLPSS